MKSEFSVKYIIFQLTPPIQRATGIAITPRVPKAISTHAPYTEGDSQGKKENCQSKKFQLTPPIQRATFAMLFPSRKNVFQLTPPIQRAT